MIGLKSKNGSKHFVSVENLTNEEVLALINAAEEFKSGKKTVRLNEPVYVSNLFFENSTRTRLSFEMAERKLGLEEIHFDADHSSVKKGESLYDTVLTLDSIGVDLLVIRHFEKAYYKDLIEKIDEFDLGVSIINGGDGSGQHPSQCMLDLMTIYEEFQRFEELKIVICGDIKNSRVARSNAMLLYQLGAKLYFAGPSYWYDESFDQYGEYVDLDSVISEVDVVMLLRVQHERHENDQDDFSGVKYHEKFGMNNVRYTKLKKSAIIMHPGPINRGVELASDLVQAPKSRFTKQMTNGVFMRMAILESVLNSRKDKEKGNVYFSDTFFIRGGIAQ